MLYETYFFFDFRLSFLIFLIINIIYVTPHYSKLFQWIHNFFADHLDMSKIYL